MSRERLKSQLSPAAASLLFGLTVMTKNSLFSSESSTFLSCVGLPGENPCCLTLLDLRIDVPVVGGGRGLSWSATKIIVFVYVSRSPQEDLFYTSTKHATSSFFFRENSIPNLLGLAARVTMASKGFSEYSLTNNSLTVYRGWGFRFIRHPWS